MEVAVRQEQVPLPLVYFGLSVFGNAGASTARD